MIGIPLAMDQRPLHSSDGTWPRTSKHFTPAALAGTSFERPRLRASVGRRMQLDPPEPEPLQSCPCRRRTRACHGCSGILCLLLSAPCCQNWDYSCNMSRQRRRHHMRISSGRAASPKVVGNHLTGPWPRLPSKSTLCNHINTLMSLPTLQPFPKTRPRRRGAVHELLI